MLEPLTFITGNAAKAEQLNRHLSHPVTHKKLDLLEIQSLDLTEVVTHKVIEAYRILQSPVLVEDTSLIFISLGKLPGTLIKWFLQEMGNEGLCRELDRFSSREAIAEVTFGYYDGNSKKLFNAEVRGSVAVTPRGQRGFGWDSIFIPMGYEQTWAEMSITDQDETSMRKIALKKLDDYLSNVST
jgi:non-canonical purine NTP pyrophosphatase (RdgB/HAM1 family)